MNGDRWPFLASLEKGLHLWMLTLGLGLDCSPCGGFLQAQAVGSPPLEFVRCGATRNLLYRVLGLVRFLGFGALGFCG